MQSQKKSRVPINYAGPRSPMRVMQVLEALSDSKDGITLAALSVRLDIPKTSLLNHLRVLASTGHVVQGDARYELGPAAIRLGAMISGGTRPLGALRTIAQKLVADTGETALVAILDEVQQDAVYLAVIEGPQPIRYAPAVGARRPLYCTAIGRALLASQNEDWIRDYLSETKLIPYNPRTIIGRTKLTNVLAQISKLGVAVTSEEHTDGVGAIASPVRDGTGNVRHAIGIAVPIARLTPKTKSLSQIVSAAAQQASWTLGATIS